MYKRRLYEVDRPICKHCNKQYILFIETFPSKMDDDGHKTYPICPYCGKAGNTRSLNGNEDFVAHPL